MAQLRDIRRRIKSVQKTQQVTRAMKMVAAARLRKAQQAIMAARPYAYKLKETISTVLSASPELHHDLLRKKTGNRLHLIVITGERGLCGSFNTNLFKEAEYVLSKAPGDISLTIIGKKGVEYFQKHTYPIRSTFMGLDHVVLSKLAHKIANDSIDLFLQDQCDKIAVTYMEFKTALTQTVVTEWLLPIDFSLENQPEHHLDFVFHPDSQTIINSLLPRFLKTELQRMLLESRTSEFGARMTAMDMATRNSEDMISQLVLQYNRARQAAITKELIEIVSGAEALKG